MAQKPTYGELEKRIRQLEEAESTRKTSDGILEGRIDLLTRPVDDIESIAFEDLFSLTEIQQLQDEFANATGVASIITRTDGTPITGPSNFCRLCRDIIRTTDKGRANCFKSDAALGRYHPEGPIVLPCMSGGLWDAGAGITISGKHIANWLIGQVRDENQTETQIISYAQDIGVDEQVMIQAFREVPSMSKAQFENIAQMLFTLATQLSSIAFQNIQQARYISQRENVEAELLRNQEKYRALVESSSDLIWEIDGSGKFTYVSPKIKSMLGYDPEDVIGKTPFDLMPGHEAQRVESEFKAVIGGKHPIQALENENIHKNGKTVILETSGVPIFDASGVFIGYRGVDRDITQRKAIEKGLYENQARFRQIFENIGVGVAIYEARDNGNDFIFKDINPYGAKSGQISRQEHIGKKVDDVYPGVRKIGLFDVFQEVWKTGVSKKHPICQYQDGRVTLWVENFISRLPSGEVMAVYEDVTSERNTEAALRVSEKRLRSTLDATPFPIAVVDLNDDNILFWSSSARELFGHTAPTASLWYEIAYPDPEYRQEVVDRWKPFLDQAQKSGKPVNTGEYRIACKDGSHRICELYATFLSQNLIVTFNDITEQKKIQRKLDAYRGHLEELVKKRTADLEAKNKELEVFTYSVSHDLKAPLRGIDGYSRLLVEEYADKLDEEGLLFLSNVRNSAGQMNQLIEDLLSYSRMERRDIQTISIDIDSTVDMLLSQRAHEIDTLKIKVAASLPFKTIYSDNETIRQILGNYLDNAIKFMNRQIPGTVDVGGSENEASWTIWVRDNGIGFDPQYHDRIFDIFQRLHRAEDFPGTGIGLAIVRKAAQRIRGRVWAETDMGKGSAFYVTIPKPDDAFYKEAVTHDGQ